MIEAFIMHTQCFERFLVQNAGEISPCTLDQLKRWWDPSYRPNRADAYACWKGYMRGLDRASPVAERARLMTPEVVEAVLDTYVFSGGLRVPADPSDGTPMSSMSPGHRMLLVQAYSVAAVLERKLRRPCGVVYGGVTYMLPKSLVNMPEDQIKESFIQVGPHRIPCDRGLTEHAESAEEALDAVRPAIEGAGLCFPEELILDHLRRNGWREMLSLDVSCVRDHYGPTGPPPIPFVFVSAVSPDENENEPWVVDVYAKAVLERDENVVKDKSAILPVACAGLPIAGPCSRAEYRLSRNATVQGGSIYSFDPRIRNILRLVTNFRGPLWQTQQGDIQFGGERPE